MGLNGHHIARQMTYFMDTFDVLKNLGNGHS